MLLLLSNNIDIDPGVILFIVVFSIWGLSCVIALFVYLYKKYKKRNKFIEQTEEYKNNNPYSEL
jgi:hypothetical protein